MGAFTAIIAKKDTNTKRDILRSVINVHDGFYNEYPMTGRIVILKLKFESPLR